MAGVNSCETRVLLNPMKEPRVLAFGRFRLDTLNQRLWRDSKPLEVRPKTFQVLLYLASNPQRLITGRELVENIWTDTSVSANLLRAYIWELRHLLGKLCTGRCLSVV